MSPYRAGRIMDVVNAVSREMGTDCADWPIDRLLSMVASLEREAREREG